MWHDGSDGTTAIFPAGETWWTQKDVVDQLIMDWSLSWSRQEAAAELRAAGVPAVAVNTAADRAEHPHREQRGWFSGVPRVSGSRVSRW